MENIKEMVNNPDHYSQGRTFRPIDVITDWDLSFSLGNAVKYISRAGRKDTEKTEEDLRKAVWYIEYEIQRLKTGQKE